MHKLVLDTDVGIDDALMLMHLLREPDVEIVAIGSTHGNCSSAQAATNTLKVLEALGHSGIPVAVGNESPVPGAVHSAHVHGADGLGDAGLPEPSGAPTGELASDQIIRLSLEQPGELILVAVGTMTNLSVALATDPNVLARYKAVWILGGISERPKPDDREMFDANVFNSPDAAADLFRAEGNIVVVPIDTSYRLMFSPEQIEQIWASTTPAARLAQAILPCYFDFYQQRIGYWSCCVHDPTVSVALLHPGLITGEVRRPMIVERYKDRYQGVGLEPGDAGFPEGSPALRIITGVDPAPAVQLVVDAIIH